MCVVDPNDGFMVIKFQARPRGAAAAAWEGGNGGSAVEERRCQSSMRPPGERERGRAFDGGRRYRYCIIRNLTNSIKLSLDYSLLSFHALRSLPSAEIALKVKRTYTPIKLHIQLLFRVRVCCHRRRCPC